jgi:hypothetical protein
MTFRKSFVALGALAMAAGAGVLLSGGLAGAANNTHVGANGNAGIAARPDGDTAACEFLNDSGTQVTTIYIDEENGSDAVYWMEYFGNSTAPQTVTFTLTGPKSSPLNKISQIFTDPGSPTVQTPFGIPLWGASAHNLTAGVYHLKVVGTEGGNASCKVTVHNPRAS